MAELERMGTMTTPVTVVRGGQYREEEEVVLVGFDRARLERALGL